eukprot:10946367-Alexandrium_andersonii.AAC.1
MTVSQPKDSFAKVMVMLTELDRDPTSSGQSLQGMSCIVSARAVVGQASKSSRRNSESRPGTR